MTAVIDWVACNVVVAKWNANRSPRPFAAPYAASRLILVYSSCKYWPYPRFLERAYSKLVTIWSPIRTAFYYFRGLLVLLLLLRLPPPSPCRLCINSAWDLFYIIYHIIFQSFRLIAYWLLLMAPPCVVSVCSVMFLCTRASVIDCHNICISTTYTRMRACIDMQFCTVCHIKVIHAKEIWRTYTVTKLNIHSYQINSLRKTLYMWF